MMLEAASRVMRLDDATFSMSCLCATHSHRGSAGVRTLIDACGPMNRRSI